MRSLLHPLLRLVIATLLLAVTSPLPMAANPLRGRSITCREDITADQEAHAERQQREQRIQQSQEAKAELLSQQGTQQYRNCEYEEALKTYQQVLAIRRELGDKAGVARALHNIGTIYLHLGQTKQSLNFFQEALAIRRKIGDQVGVARTLHNIDAVTGNANYTNSNDNLDPMDSNVITTGHSNSSAQVSLLFDDDEKQATPPPLPYPSGEREIISDPPRPTSPSSNSSTVPYTPPPNVAYPSGDREAMPAAR